MDNAEVVRKALGGSIMASIDPGTTALVIIDPQKNFLSEGGVV